MQIWKTKFDRNSIRCYRRLNRRWNLRLEKLKNTQYTRFICGLYSQEQLEGYFRHKGNIQGVSRLVDITAEGDFLGLCDEKSSYKHVSDFGRLRSYDRLTLRREGNDYGQ